MKKLKISEKLAKSVSSVFVEDLSALSNADTPKQTIFQPYFAGENAIVKKVEDDRQIVFIARLCEYMETITGFHVDTWTVILALKNAGFEFGIQYFYNHGNFIANLVVVGCKTTADENIVMVKKK